MRSIACDGGNYAIFSLFVWSKDWLIPTNKT
jgi:hypothetical protein